jgi:hypothetical protein
VNGVLLQIERVNDAVIADASAEAARSFQPMVRVGSQACTDLIDFCFDGALASAAKA